MPSVPSAHHLAECLQLCLENPLFAFEAMELDGQALAIGIGGARDLFTQTRQITLHDPQIGLDRASVQRIGRDASSASTVQRSGVTSAIPLTTKTRRVTVCAW